MFSLKHILIFSALVALSGCKQFQSKKEALARHYESTLEEDYEAYKNSPECAAFKRRYADMLQVSKRIADNPPQPFTESNHKGEIICLGLSAEVQNAMNWEKWESEKKEVVYTDFINPGKKVTAIMISGNFYKKEGSDEVGLESEIHAAYRDLTNPNFLRDKKRYGALSFKEFCERRITIDKVNNSKFILVLDKKRLETYDFLSKKTLQNGDFQESQYEGFLYVYNFEKNKTEQALKIYAASSDTIDPGYQALDEAVRKDLEQNVKFVIRQKLDSLYAYKGSDPMLKIH